MKPRHGFTLVELLVVIAIIAVLIALLLPAVQKVRESAARLQCQNNLKQMSLACHSYHDVQKTFPPGGDFKYIASWMIYILPYIEQKAVYDNLWPLFTGGFYQEGAALPANDSGIPIRVYSCPSDPRGPVTDQGDPYSGWKLGGMKPVFMTDYVGIAGIDVGVLVYAQCSVNANGNTWPPASATLGIFNNTFNPTTLAGDTVSISQIADGTSNTLLIGERPFITPGGSGTYTTAAYTTGFWNAWDGYWACAPDYSIPMGYYIYSGQLTRDTISGVNNTTTVISTAVSTNASCGSGPFLYGHGPNNVNNACSFNYIWSNHVGGSNFGMADGSVHFVQYSISTSTINALSTYAGGEVLGSDWTP